MESGILDKMTSAEIKLQEALFEIITSEESNLKSLIILVKHFKASYEGKPTQQQMKARKLSSGDVESDKTKSKTFRLLDTRCLCRLFKFNGYKKMVIEFIQVQMTCITQYTETSSSNFLDDRTNLDV